MKSLFQKLPVGHAVYQKQPEDPLKIFIKVRNVAFRQAAPRSAQTEFVRQVHDTHSNWAKLSWSCNIRLHANVISSVCHPRIIPRISV